MTNEEKARELAERWHCYDKIFLELTEWKDQQFKEYLEKKMCEYEEKRDATARIGRNDYAHLIFDTKAATYREIINELFKEG